MRKLELELMNVKLVETGGKPEQSKTAEPLTVQQTVLPDSGYTLKSVTINKVTNAIDSNIQPDNIKKDVTILGITGTLEGGGEPSQYLKTVSSDGESLTITDNHEIQTTFTPLTSSEVTIDED